MIRLYTALCLVGAALPFWFLGSFLADNGVDAGVFFDQMTASDISLFAWADVFVAALGVIAFALCTRPRRWWAPVVATLAVGPSLGLPLLLLLRERERVFDAVRAGS